MLVLLAGSAIAAHRRPGNVPPTEEIEVLDPNADPLGRPAVELTRSSDGLQVEIPPAVLVHKYYYTGDRSFQAQLLPGGPSIVVVNHPKTGERCYIDVQMLPGAPRVTYTDDCIEYDYGENGITIHFGLFGQPKVKYRSGRPLPEKIGNVVHAEEIHHGVQRVGQGIRHVACAGSDAFKEAVIDGHGVVKSAALPVANIVRLMPLGTALLDSDRYLIRKEKIAEHRRQTELHHAERESRLAEQTIPTVR